VANYGLSAEKILIRLRFFGPNRKRVVASFLSFFSFLLVTAPAFSQVILTGKVYDAETQTPLEGVSVRDKTKGSGELTDHSGYYSVTAAPRDSIEFYMLGYGRYYYVAGQAGAQKMQVFLHVQKYLLPEVQVMAHRNPKLDSLNRRFENAEIFNYRRPSVASTIVGSLFHPISGLEYLANSAKRKRLRRFQADLIEDEHDRYVDSRYSRQQIADLTGLEGDELEKFRRNYRPSYEEIQKFTEYDMLVYIKDSYKTYLRQKNSMDSTAKP